MKIKSSDLIWSASLSFAPPPPSAALAPPPAPCVTSPTAGRRSCKHNDAHALLARTKAHKHNTQFVAREQLRRDRTNPAEVRLSQLAVWAARRHTHAHRDAGRSTELDYSAWNRAADGSFPELESDLGFSGQTTREKQTTLFHALLVCLLRPSDRRGHTSTDLEVKDSGEASHGGQW